MPRLLDAPADWTRITLARAGTYEPAAGLEAAERAGSWAAWRKAVDALSSDGVLGLVEEAGLTGRGGAGFPAARKWRACRATPGVERYVVANGYEADPGAAIARTLMEQDPHAVLEGAALTAFAVGAREVVVAVRAEYTVAIERLRAAIAEADDAGLIGLNAMAKGFDLVFDVRPVQGAFVAGEETVLLRVLEGKRGMPDQRPPYPTRRGLDGRPTVVHSVETLAAIPWIVRNGAEAFRAAGRNGATGTKIVQVSGSVREPGLVEAPLGVPLRDLVAAAGGVAANHHLKAVLVGGPAGGFLPPDLLDTPLEPAALKAQGAILGSGTLLVADERACIVELGRLMERFMSDESCGKCIPCRIGARRLYEIAERFTDGRPRPTDPQLLQDLSADVVAGSLCGHGINAPNPLTSGMRHFAAEYEAHFRDGTCPAGVCRPIRLAAASPVPAR